MTLTMTPLTLTSVQLTGFWLRTLLLSSAPSISFFFLGTLPEESSGPSEAGASFLGLASGGDSEGRLTTDSAMVGVVRGSSSMTAEGVHVAAVSAWSGSPSGGASGNGAACAGLEHRLGVEAVTGHVTGALRFRVSCTWLCRWEK